MQVKLYVRNIIIIIIIMRCTQCTQRTQHHHHHHCVCCVRRKGVRIYFVLEAPKRKCVGSSENISFDFKGSIFGQL